MISACNHAGFLEEGWEYFDLMTKVYKLNPEVDHYSCMADLLGRRGKLKEALEFIHNMPVKPDEGIWGALLGACKIHHNIEIGQYAADRLFEIEPQAAAPYAEIANIYASAGRWNGVSAIRTRMKCKQVTKSGACFFTQGVVHRDVKPGNFLFSRKVNKGYLIDFNLAMDLHHKYVTSDKSAMSYDMGFNHVPLAHAKSLPHAKSRTFLTTKAWEAVNQEAGKSSKSLSVLKNLKRKTNQTKEHADLSSRNIIKSQGADGSGITSAKDATSTRIPSAERMREPVPMQGRKELISLAQEAMQGPNHEVTSIPASKRKRIAAPYERLDRKLVYLTPMPLHSSGIAVAGAGLIKRGNAKHKKEGPCVGTKGFRAPEVLLRSPYQGPKIDIWSAGVTLLYLITGRSPFVGDPDQNVKDIAKLRGSEDLWEVAKLHNRESSFPAELYDMQSLPSKKLRDWCGLNTRRPDFLQVVPRSFFDLVDKCLTVNPRLRISAEEAIRHEFFAPCHEQLRKQRMLRQGLSLDSGTSLLLNTQPDM